MDWTDLLRQLVIVSESAADGGLGADHTARVLLLFHLDSLVLGVSKFVLGLQKFAVVQLVRLH